MSRPFGPFQFFVSLRSERTTMAELSAVTKAQIPATMGSVLSLAHAAGMQSSFPLLAKNYKFSKVLLFGRILGKAQDYLVAIGLEGSYVGSKKFFYWCAATARSFQFARCTPAIVACGSFLRLYPKEKSSQLLCILSSLDRVPCC